MPPCKISRPGFEHLWTSVGTSYDSRSYSYRRCGAGPINVCYRAGGGGGSVLVEVTVLRLRCELLFQTSEIGSLVSSVVLASRVSSLALSARVSSVVSASHVSLIAPTSRVSSLVSVNACRQ